MLREELTRDYIQKESQGLVSVSKIETDPNADDQTQYYALSFKRFSPVDGSELYPRVYYFTLDEMNAIKQDLVDWASDVDKILTDLQSL